MDKGSPDLTSASQHTTSKKPARPTSPADGWTLLAAWGPCGYVPVAPGTAGTLAAIPLYLLMASLSWPLYLITLIAFTALSCHAAERAGRYWGISDASPIVIDEVAGYLTTMVLVRPSWTSVIIGFALFRILDVLKPWPASYFERSKSGFATVMDDVAAGGYGALILGLLAWCGSRYNWPEALAIVLRGH